MLWAPVLVLVVTHISYGDFKPVLVQPPSTEVKAELNTEIPCTLSTGKNFDIYRVIWLQQKPGSGLRMVYHYRTGSTQGIGPGIPNRFSVRDDVSQRRWYLVITGVQPEDDADYYCATYFDDTYKYIFGVGTQMDVLTGEVKPPTVSIYPPSEEELNTDNATLLCAITDFNPKTVTVEWHMDGVKQTNGVHISPLSKQSDHTYTKISFFTLPSSEYIKHEDYTCKVTHQGKDIVQTLKRSECA